MQKRSVFLLCFYMCDFSKGRTPNSVITSVFHAWLKVLQIYCHRRRRCSSHTDAPRFGCEFGRSNAGTRQLGGDDWLGYIGCMELDYCNIPEESGPQLLVMECTHSIWHRICRPMEQEVKLKDAGLQRLFATPPVVKPTSPVRKV